MVYVIFSMKKPNPKSGCSKIIDLTGNSEQDLSCNNKKEHRQTRVCHKGCIKMDWINFEVAFLYFCNWFTLGPFSQTMFDMGRIYFFQFELFLFSLFLIVFVKRTWLVKKFMKNIFWESMCWRPHFLNQKNVSSF